MMRQEAAYNHLNSCARLLLFILAEEQKNVWRIFELIFYETFVRVRIMCQLPLIQRLMFAIYETSPNPYVGKDGERNMKCKMNEWQNIYEARRNEYNRNCRESFIYMETVVFPSCAYMKVCSIWIHAENRLHHVSMWKTMEKNRSTIWHVPINIAENLFGMQATRGLEHSALDWHTGLMPFKWEKNVHKFHSKEKIQICVHARIKLVSL